jgi:hypothetical protein
VSSLYDGSAFTAGSPTKVKRSLIYHIFAAMHYCIETPMGSVTAYHHLGFARNHTPVSRTSNIQDSA